MEKILSVVLNPFVNDNRVLKEAQSLSSFGYKVTVLALHENELKTNETIRDIKVIRVPLITKLLPKWKVIQFFKYIELIVRVVFTQFRHADVVHCHDLNALPIGILFKLLSFNTKKVIYDAHEYETEVYGLSKVEKKLRFYLEGLLIRYAEETITVSDSIAREYSSLYEMNKPKLILNCPAFTKQRKSDLFREELKIREDQIIFLYQGGFSSGRGIEILLETFSNLDSDNIVIVFMGYGPLDKLVQSKADSENSIFYRSAVGHEVLLNYTSSADYGILFYEDTCLNHRYCSPNKIFEYLMAGLPVLTSNLFEMKRLVEQEGVGVVADTNTVDGFKKAIDASLRLEYTSVQKNVFSAREKYCWEEQEKVLQEIYDEL
ncbi:glycosyltransferase [Reinekea sp.]|jgi:glycosyltransferase involved in cell wall biosynthesis|uniref:glycosyltransferase n=1 Tax=Reinekea sp. TaxID=1970455 RepID=UPI003989275F